MDAGVRVCLVKDFEFINIRLQAWEEGLVTGPSQVKGCVQVKFDTLGASAAPLAVEIASLRAAEGGGKS
ncbi:MAG: hypothetical protein KBD66_01770 [Candidatus Doudnabacteria bacterium]|nr:hypothetical protein [Candidatus Doudnabacteria bacterium]